VRDEERPGAGLEDGEPESSSLLPVSPAPAVLQAESTTKSALSFNYVISLALSRPSSACQIHVSFPQGPDERCCSAKGFRVVP
jgi:hypothetical protein